MNQDEYRRMFNILNKIKYEHNPFQTEYFKPIKNYAYPKNGKYKEEKIVRCPICLGNVMTQVRPDRCRHIFCLYCLLKWSESSSLCPCCKQEFSTYVKIKIDEPWVENQGLIFC